MVIQFPAELHTVMVLQILVQPASRTRIPNQVRSAGGQSGSVKDALSILGSKNDTFAATSGNDAFRGGRVSDFVRRLGLPEFPWLGRA